jgi:hypothetical protein
MIAFLIGFLISALAAVPSLLSISAKRGSELKIRFRLWIISAAIRFAIIGISLLILFRLTDIDRIPVVIGVLAAYFTSFGYEAYLATRSTNS